MNPGTEKETGPRCLAVIAGSGLEGLGERFHVRRSVAFEDVDGLGACTVAGHQGRVLSCRLGDEHFFLVVGRRHVYEGGSYGMGRLVQWLAARGATGLLVLSAAGALKKAFPPGELVSVDGMFDLQNFPRLQNEFWAPPIPGVPGGRPLNPAVLERGAGGYRTETSPTLTAAVRTAAARAGIPLRRGILACCAGPAYETPAEVRYLTRLGADLATMSSAPEVLFARRSGLEVAVVAVVTNYGVGIGTTGVAHADVLEKAAAMAEPVARLITNLIDLK